MIDTHSHILFNIDDGSSSIEESINIVKKLYDLGFKAIILTPHYIKDTIYTKNNKDKLNTLRILEEETKKQNINIKYYLGNEIHINNKINDLVLNNECRTINNTRYILVELPFDGFNDAYLDYLYDLTLIGYKVVIAHVERYTYFQENIKNINKLLELDNIYIQCNYSSITGKYGKGAEKLFKKLLKNNMVDFLGTDVHKQNSDIFENFEKIKRKIIKIIGEDRFNKITYYNLINLLCDKNIEE